jgi:uncharacterized membrane protein YoaK (UPF0700 family)
MTTKPTSLGIIHKILIVFVAINIVGDIGNVAFWWANPASRAASLNTSYIGVNAGVRNAFTIGTVILLLVSVVYMVALYGLLKRKIWAPKIIIAISVVNRALALVLYFISPAFAFWAVWSIILIAISYFDWSKTNKATNTALPTAAPTTIS